MVASIDLEILRVRPYPRACVITHRYLRLHHFQAHHDICKGPSMHTQTALDSVSGHVLQPPGFFWDKIRSLK